MVVDICMSPLRLIFLVVYFEAIMDVCSTSNGYKTNVAIAPILAVLRLSILGLIDFSYLSESLLFMIMVNSY